MPRLVNNKIEYAGGIKISAQAPIDDRTLLSSYDDLFDINTFNHNVHFGLTVITKYDKDGNENTEKWTLTSAGERFFNSPSSTNDDIALQENGGDAETEALRNSLWKKDSFGDLAWNDPLTD